MAPKSFSFEKWFGVGFNIGLEKSAGKILNGFEFPELPLLIYDGKEITVEPMTWGLIPGWCRNEDEAKKLRSGNLNARCESINEKPSFRDSFRLKHFGLLPVSAFFEYQHFNSAWTPDPTGKLTKFFEIKLDRVDCFFLGVLWSEWAGGKYFSVITMPSNSLMSQIHNAKLRQPVIVQEGLALDWFKGEGRESFFVPSDEIPLVANEISKPVKGEKKIIENLDFGF